ncbi:hypothetical protein VP1G_06241 [Cytospora mali]|uniref:BTB domain-containing protein n=1 Tax=Cytospora mali TaxID=578113 RepID=A0A194V4X7_CYTMA|nr:hypothetical protein VP1G_06241 [Valsa mali var. pyri (nom. inval.)]
MGVQDKTIAQVGPIIHFDVDGDLRLDVGEDDKVQRFIVCSKTLSRASKVFKAMLYGNFVESKPDNPGQEWAVELPEDDPKSLATILCIIHSKFSKVPNVVTRDELYGITVLTDKYDMTEILRPWATEWLKPYNPDTRPLGQNGDEALLWIAWELGYTKLFERALSHLQENCIVNLHGKLLANHNSTPLEDNDHIKALGILDGNTGLAARRIDRIQSLSFCVQSRINDLARIDQNVRECSVGLFSTPSHTDRCKTWYLGSLMRSLVNNGYYPVLAASNKNCSVQETRTKLAVVCDGILASDFYTTCSPAISLKVSFDGICRNVELTDSQRKHLQQQAAKAGLPIQDSKPSQPLSEIPSLFSRPAGAPSSSSNPAGVPSLFSRPAGAPTFAQPHTSTLFPPQR